MSRSVRIVEVGPRDGLQNEKCNLPLDLKIQFVNLLSESGVSEIEAGSFVSPKWVPQMEASDSVFKQIKRHPDIVYSALVPNVRGLDRALEVRVDKVSIFTAASETFNQKNINASISESLKRLRPVATRTLKEPLPLRGYISTVFYCPYEGQMNPDACVPVIRALLEMGVGEIALSDTIGKAEPDDIRAVLDKVVSICASDKLAMHLHDTYGRATENALVAWKEYGIGTFDSAAGGLGGCPFAEGAPGNVSTENMVRAFGKAGAELSIDLDKTSEAAQLVRELVRR